MRKTKMGVYTRKTIDGIYFGFILLTTAVIVLAALTLPGGGGGSNLESRVEMLEMKTEMLQSEIDAIDLSNLVEVEAVETGTCIYQVGATNSLVNYVLYSHRVSNITHYFADFSGGSAAETFVASLSSANCPTVWTHRSDVEIYHCTQSPSRDLSVFSQINTNWNYGNDAVIQLQGDSIGSITESGGEPILIASEIAGIAGPCFPNTYTMGPRSLGTGLGDGLQVRILIFANTAGPLTIETNGLRIALPNFNAKRK